MNECILVVDDDPAIVGAIAIALEKEGYRVLRAYNGIEALDIAMTTPELRLILLDVMMPKMDGISALILHGSEDRIIVVLKQLLLELVLQEVDEL